MKKPNIILILADDLGIGDLGCYGSKKIPTPHLDRIAAEGMLFKDAHSSSAVCTPSRYSVLTGRYGWRTRLQKWVIGGFGAPLIEQGELTLASLLETKGYRTAAIGKWHLGLTWYDKNGKPLPLAQADDMEADGFSIDYQRGFDHGPTSVGFQSFFGISGSLDMPPYAFLENENLVELPDREKEHYFHQQRRGMQAPNFKDDTVDLTFADRACEFLIDCADKDEPFFLYLPTAAPHRPCDIRPEFVVGSSQAGDRGDMVVLFDWIVGRVLQTLEETGQARDTLLIVTSDNGARLVCANGKDYGHASNGQYRGQKADIWEGGHREPLLIRWPGTVNPGSVNSDLICLSDFLATLAELTESPLQKEEGIDSISFLGSLLETECGTRQSMIHHSGDGVFAYRKGPWKLIAGTGSGGFSDPMGVGLNKDVQEGQLYNLKADPQEHNNLWEQKLNLAQTMQDELAAVTNLPFEHSQKTLAK